jgi:hypothetical protein
MRVLLEEGADQGDSGVLQVKETKLQTAKRRLSEEQKSPCSDIMNVVFWKSEVMRLREELKPSALVALRF